MQGITQAIHIAKNNFSQNLYFKEDIARLINELRDCIRQKATDAEGTLRRNIILMFASYGIDVDKKWTPDQYEKQLAQSDIQSIKNFPALCWTELLKMSTAYKTPQEYMERLVNRLIKPEYNLPDSTLRVKILKQLLGNLDCLKGTPFESKKLLRIIENDYHGSIDNIGDEIFDNYLTPILPHKYLRALLDVYGDILYGDGGKDEALANLVAQYDTSVAHKTAQELLQHLHANHPVTVTDANGQSVDTFPIADHSKALIIALRDHIDNARRAFKETYDEDLEQIEDFSNVTLVRQYPVAIDYACTNEVIKPLQSKPFTDKLKKYAGINVMPEAVNLSLLLHLQSTALSTEAQIKLGEHLTKQLKKTVKKGNDAYRAFVDEVTAIENQEKQAQWTAIFTFVRNRGIDAHIFTEEIKESITEMSGISLDNRLPATAFAEALSALAATAPAALADINFLLIKQLRSFRKKTNQQFSKALDNATDRSTIPEVLKIANDLSEGRYKDGPAMKEILYLFAFAFDMSIDFEGDPAKALTDVKKNLFEDFYCDNIVRYIHDYQRAGVYPEPAGISIQFKNFVEIVYLYWLNQDSAVTPPAEKYRAANAMIKSIVSKVKTAEKIVAKDTGQTGKSFLASLKLAKKKELGTYYYRNMVRTDIEDGDDSLKVKNFLSLPQEAFVNILLEHYDVDTVLKYTSAEAFTNESEQGIAKVNFSCLIDAFDKTRVAGDFSDNFTSIEFYESVFLKQLAQQNVDPETHQNLSTLIGKINKQMQQVLREAETNDLTSFTRTKYLYLYYQLFLLEHDDTSYNETFEDFCQEFCEQLNIDLEACSYQRFSEKNLIDMLLLYAAFINLRTNEI